MSHRIGAVTGALILTAAALLAVGAAARPAGAAGIPVPERDPFYAVPADVATQPNGAILASRPITALAFGVPMPVSAWQVKYRSTDATGGATADVTTVLVPTAHWTGSGPRPLVSYQTAEDGVAGKCAPSYALRAGLAAADSNSAAETSLISLAVARGWAVTVPDYEGPQSQFLAGAQEAHGVLDAIRASLHFTPAHLVATTKVGMWGYSGGSIASIEAAQLQPAYAPDVHISAIAIGGLVADIAQTILKFSGSFAGGAIAMGVNGPLRAFPDAHLEQYLSAAGRTKVAAAAGDCIDDAVLRFPFLRIEAIEAFPGALETPAVAALLTANSPDGVPTNPTVSTALYDYHASADELAPVGPDRALMRRFCAAGNIVQHVENPLAEHLSETALGAPGALAFLSAQFAGAAPVNTCGSLPAP